MNIVFISNYFNHHQNSLSCALDKLTANSYSFIQTSNMSDERRLLGYDEEIANEFIVDYRKSSKKVNKKIANADVIIVGSSPKTILKCLAKSEKLIFRYSERIFKKRIGALRYVHRFIRLREYYLRKSENYLLCAGAFVARDYAKFGLYKNRAYKWGYFPETIRYENISDVIDKKRKNKLLWCGRFIDWKHPDDAVKVAKMLRDDGYEFELNLIGRGDMEPKLRKMIIDYDLEDNVKLLGSMKPMQVRKHMEEAGIYLFTSDRQEGWGAVLNEAMNSGCAVVASNEIGSVPYLLEDKYNGFVYKSGSIDSLYEKVKMLLDNTTIQERVGKEAYHTIIKEWNAEIAAGRLLKLSQHILNGEVAPDLYETGPCSKA